MAKKLSATELRAEAEAMLKKAQEMEDANTIKIGRLVLKYQTNGFKAFDLATFTGEVAALSK